MKKRKFLQEVYENDAKKDMKSFYDDWSGNYDEEVAEHGYITPKRCAEALAKQVEDFSAPVLDFGCGTGMGGEALSHAGFKTVDGCDISKPMVELARVKNLYRNLWVTEESRPVAFEPGTYLHITAVGVISVGAAEPTLMDDLYDVLPSGGTLTFSFNELTLQEPLYEQRLHEYVDTAAVHLLFKEHGEHLPGLDMTSTVYVIQKT